jgi:hypothetical protein
MADDDDKNEDNVRIFDVVTTFQKYARRPGGVPRDRAIKYAATRVDELKPEFDDWLDKELQALAEAVRKAEEGHEARGWIDTINGHARQLRDVGTTMDSELLTYIAGSLCMVLDEMAAGAKFNRESISCHVDALFLARQRRYRGLKPEQVPELIAGLRSVVEHISTSPN